MRTSNQVKYNSYNMWRLYLQTPVVACRAGDRLIPTLDPSSGIPMNLTPRGAVFAFKPRRWTEQRLQVGRRNETSAQGRVWWIWAA
jgi:hypothetical protein